LFLASHIPSFPIHLYRRSVPFSRLSNPIDLPFCLSKTHQVLTVKHRISIISVVRAIHLVPGSRISISVAFPPNVVFAFLASSINFTPQRKPRRHYHSNLHRRSDDIQGVSKRKRKSKRKSHDRENLSALHKAGDTHFLPQKLIRGMGNKASPAELKARKREDYRFFLDYRTRW
jgi:hypothetical protein